jgi:hypothetical protein
MKYDLVSKALKYQFNLLNTVISETKGWFKWVLLKLWT